MDRPQPCPSPEWKTNLFAPWRIQYVRTLGPEQGDGCFLCQARDQRGQEEQNLLLWRTPRCLAVLNRFPYTGGHMLISPLAHVDCLEEMDAPTLTELMELTRDALATLRAAIKPEGFNVGFNIGRCAGAGLPGHIHLHVVPRWNGDTNFMPVLSDVHVIPQGLLELRRQVVQEAAQLKLPRVLYA
jgi:ATP adenylyltransferase